MPWEIKEDTPQCSGYGVFKEGTNELEGCHETKEKAQAQMAALYSTEEMDKNMSNISKAMVLEGDFVTFVCEDDERKIGRVEYVMNNPGTLGMEGSKYSVEYMENDKPIIVRLYEEEDGAWEEEQYLVYKRMSDVIKIESITVSQEIEVEMVSKAYQDCGCPTCKEMDVACEDCPVCNPDMGKADSVRVGQMVSWNSSGGRARGKVKRIVTSGSYKVPNSDFTITGTSDSPAVVIEVYRDGKPTGRMVGHKIDTLSKSYEGCECPECKAEDITCEECVCGSTEMSKADTYTPTAGMKSAAKRALKWKEDGKATGAGTPVGWGRASDIVAGRSMSLDTVKRMYSFFSRHEVDKKGKDFYNTSNPSNGRIMWDAWGGDAGFSWSRKIVEREKSKKVWAGSAFQ